MKRESLPGAIPNLSRYIDTLPHLTCRSRPAFCGFRVYVRLRLRVWEWHSAEIMAASSEFLMPPPLSRHRTDSNNGDGL